MSLGADIDKLVSASRRITFAHISGQYEGHAQAITVGMDFILKFVWLI